MSEVLSNSLFSCGCKDARALFTSVGLFLDSAKLCLSYCYERQRQKLKWEFRLDETNTFFTVRTVKQWNSLHPSWQVFKTRLDNAFSNSIWSLGWACFEEDLSREGPDLCKWMMGSVYVRFLLFLWKAWGSQAPTCPYLANPHDC